MKISTYFLLFFALFLCNFAKAQDTIPPKPSPKLQKIMNKVPEIKKAINECASYSLLRDGNSMNTSAKYLMKLLENAIDNKTITNNEDIEIRVHIQQILGNYLSWSEPRTKQKKAEIKQDKAEIAKEEQEMLDLLAESETDTKKDTLSQIAKDIENKVAGAEQKYVAYVEENPELKADEKVRVLYEKCKAKLKK